MYLPFYLLSLCLVPFNGILVRYRLAYYLAQGDLAWQDPMPKDDDATVSHDPASNKPITSEQRVASDTDTIGCKSDSADVTDIPSFLKIATRVRQKEGYTGLFKGLLPTMIVNLFVPLFSYGGMPRLYISPSPATINENLERALFGALFYSIALIWVYRAIATRARLDIFSLSVWDGSKILFSHYEREKPWRIYSFGLLSVLVINIFLRILVLRPLNNVIGPRSWQSGDSQNYYLYIAATVLLVLASTLVLAPFDVVTTRLAVQRNDGGTGTVDSSVAPLTQHVSVDVEDATSVENNSNYDAEAVAVRFRPDNDLEPYKNAYDCVKRIVREEGWGVLYRGWFFTFLGVIFSAETY